MNHPHFTDSSNFAEGILCFLALVCFVAVIYIGAILLAAVY